METKTNISNFENKKKAIGLIHKVYLSQLKSSRKYTASTKTKSEVRGGGRKPWKQKGTGQARAGSIRSPLWVGGGVIFGPKPRVVSKKINKKENRLAIISALHLKKEQITFVNELFFDQIDLNIKTKSIASFLTESKINLNSRVLFVLAKPNKGVWLATRNLKNIEVTTGNCLNLAQILNATQIILSNTSLELINLTYGKS